MLARVKMCTCIFTYVSVFDFVYYFCHCVCTCITIPLPVWGAEQQWEWMSSLNSHSVWGTGVCHHDALAVSKLHYCCFLISVTVIASHAARPGSPTPTPRKHTVSDAVRLRLPSALWSSGRLPRTTRCFSVKAHQYTKHHQQRQGNSQNNLGVPFSFYHCPWLRIRGDDRDHNWNNSWTLLCHRWQVLKCIYYVYMYFFCCQIKSIDLKSSNLGLCLTSLDFRVSYTCFSVKFNAGL